MAERAEALVLQMSADITRMQKALERVTGDTNRQLGRTEQRFDKLNAHVKRSGDMLARDLRSSIAAIGATFAVREIAQAADQWTNLRNQVALYKDVLGPVEETTSRLVALANDAGVSVSSLGTTFAASARSAKLLGASAADVFAFNEAVAKGAQIANTGVAAVDGALGQLSQALGSPKVQLQEFNSVIEGTPRLAQAFADGIAAAGGSIAKLRELIGAGKISNVDLFQGLLKELPNLRKEFAASEATISRSVNRINNAFLQYVGNADKAMNGSKLLNGFLELVANNFALLADATVVAALAIGGTLAAQAVAKAVAGLSQMTDGVRKATTAMGALRAAGSVMMGPLGIAIAAVGGALAGMALSAANSQDAFERLEGTIADYKRTQEQIAKDTNDLRTAQKALSDAIRAQGDAAESTANREVAAIDRRLIANKKLADSQKASIQLQLIDAERTLSQRKLPADWFTSVWRAVGEPFTARPDIEGLSVYQSQLISKRMLEERGPNGTSEADFRAYANQRLMNAGNSIVPALSQDDEYLLSLIGKVDEAEAKVADLRLQIQNLDKVPGGSAGVFTGDTGAATDATAAVQGYRHAIEELQAVLKPLQELRATDVATLQQLQAAYDANRATMEATAEDTTYLAEQEASLEAERTRQAETLERGSRVAVQALLAYAGASGDLAEAMRQANAAADLMTAPDRAFVFGEIKGQIEEATAAIATGYAKLKMDYATKYAQINKAMIASLGFDKEAFDAMSASAKRQLNGAADVFLEAFAVALRDLNDGAASLAQDAVALNLDTAGSGPSTTDLITGDADTLAAGILSPDANQAFREQMRDSVKQAMRDGIRTGDWDEAFRSVLADAVTSGLDAALNRVGDWLADFLFAPDGFLGGVINGAGAWAGSMIFGGARAAGGPVSPGKTYLVGERGPELLTMGGAGNVINAGDTNRMLSGMGGGAGGVVLQLNVAGSIDAVTWPRVEQALTVAKYQIMQAVPTVVNGTIIHNRKNGLNGFRKT